jgi:hypothetical protein
MAESKQLQAKIQNMNGAKWPPRAWNKAKQKCTSRGTEDISLQYMCATCSRLCSVLVAVVIEFCVEQSPKCS